MRHTYSSRSLNFNLKRRVSRPWKWLFLFLFIGFVAGIIVDRAMIARKPIELIVSTPPAIETIGSANAEDMWSESENISVSMPKPNTIISSPIVVKGLERTFEQNVVIRLSDEKGQELARMATTGNALDAGIHGPYSAELNFEKSATQNGVLEVFQISPKDGSEIDKVVVPIKFK